jgi:hypothetical protein
VPFLPGTVPGWSDACFGPVTFGERGPPPRAAEGGGSSWAVITSPATDADGWVYGTAFDHLRDDRPGGRASKRANDRVRSRLWRRCVGKEPEEEEEEDDAETTLQGGAEAMAVAGSAVDGERATSDGTSSSSSSRQSSAAAAAAAAVSAAAGSAAASGRATLTGALAGAATAAAAAGAVRRASLAGMWAAFTRLLRDAAERHNTSMITPDLSGLFFVVSGHGEELKRQQLGQLRHLVWFSAVQEVVSSMQPGGLGCNVPGAVLPAGPALAAQRGSSSAGDVPGAAAAAAASTGAAQHSLRGRPQHGLVLHLGSTTTPGRDWRGSVTTAAAPATTPGGAGLRLHVAPAAMLDELLAGARYAQAAYGYVAAAGHMSSVSSALKLLATLPLFDPITGGRCVVVWCAVHTEGVDAYLLVHVQLGSF